MMTAKLLSKYLIVGTLVAAGSLASASDYKRASTENYFDVERTVRELENKVGSTHVLVVIDLDNTTLKTRSDFASEHWSLWQADLIRNGTKELPAVASTFEGMIAVQDLALSVAPMDLVAKEIAPILASLRSRNISVIALSSRAKSLRDATQRELARNGIVLSTKENLKLNTPSYAYKPYDLSNLEESGLTQEDAQEFGLSKPSDVVFDSGAMLTDGQHKGIMLRTLLARSSRTFSGIVFVDDRLKHHEAMEKAFSKTDIYVRSIHYTKTAKDVETFKSGSKDKVNAQWCAFANGLEQATFGGKLPDSFNTCASY